MRKNVLSLMIIAALCLPAARGDQPLRTASPQRITPSMFRK
jgi:hypothetical protein